MKPDSHFVNQPRDFWAHVRTISQEVGYTEPSVGYWKVPPGLTTPSNYRRNGGPKKNIVLAIGRDSICEALERLDLTTKHVVTANGRTTRFGKVLCDYFQHRATVLNKQVQSQLMDAKAARALFRQCKAKYSPTIPFVMNKQKGNKKAEAFLTCMVNMIVEKHTKGIGFDHDPNALTTVTKGGQPLRTFARRLDGAFPAVINPLAVWEIKEYYYTTTFGSRVADGVYETLLDGMEMDELRHSENVDVKHYLLADSHFTWWACGKSYLCRLIDMLHMGYVDEILFGREVARRLPVLVKEWVREAKKRDRRGWQR